MASRWRGLLGYKNRKNAYRQSRRADSLLRAGHRHSNLPRSRQGSAYKSHNLLRFEPATDTLHQNLRSSYLPDSGPLTFGVLPNSRPAVSASVPTRFAVMWGQTLA